jgi:carbamoylphosphate synthase large subunit
MRFIITGETRTRDQQEETEMETKFKVGDVVNTPDGKVEILEVVPEGWKEEADVQTEFDTFMKKVGERYPDQKIEDEIWDAVNGAGQFDQPYIVKSVDGKPGWSGTGIWVVSDDGSIS